MSIESRFTSCQSLKEISTIGIGGLARYYFAPQTVSEMERAFQWAVQKEVPLLVIGKGSNCVFDDRGYAGLVLHNKIDFCRWQQNRVDVGAGYSFSLLGVLSAKRNLSGLEFAAGIPASVGGAIFMNAGAGGQQTADFLDSVAFLHKSGEVQIFKKGDLEFSYRLSSFQNLEGCILAACFSLCEDNEARERQLKALQYRLKTQPYREKSFGSIFKNPAEGVLAAQAIERCGLKGVQRGGAKISSLHANFIVNRGNARAFDVKELIDLIQKEVFCKMSVLLEPEVRFISYES